MMRTWMTVVAALGLSASASAGDLTTWQGRLLDATGIPVQGSHLLRFEILDGSGTTLATQELTLDISSGYASVQLDATMSAAAASSNTTQLRLSLDGAVLSTEAIGAAPAALVASRVYIEDGPGTCGATEQGQLRWDTTLGGLRVCIDGAWHTATSGGGAPGSTAASPVSSCAAVTQSGRAYIDIAGSGAPVYCDVEGGWTRVFQLYDDNNVDDLPDGVTAMAAGFSRDNAFFIGNTALNALAFDDARWCMSDGVSTACFPITDADWGYRLSDVDGLVGGQRRVIAALSGQINDGRTEDGANGDFYATKTGQPVPMCPTYTGTFDSNGQIRQWQHSDADWHTWGYGLSLYKNGANAHGPYNELAWGSETLAAGYCGAEWERFWMEVRPITAGALGDNELSPADDCAAIATARPGAESGNYWIQPEGTGPVRVTCDFDGGWTHVLHYQDDNNRNDLPDYRFVVAGGFTSAESHYVGNQALNAIPFSEAQWCTSDGANTHCFPISASDYTYTGGEVAVLSDNVRKVIGALSGQVPYGASVDGASGDFYASRVAQHHPVCPAHAAANYGHIRQWTGNDADWHSWGNGLSLYLDGADSQTNGWHNELAWGAENLAAGTCGPEWELFYIQVR